MSVQHNFAIAKRDGVPHRPLRGFVTAPRASSADDSLFIDQENGRTPAHIIPPADFRELRMRFDSSDRTLWQYLSPKERPSFTFALLDEMARAQAWLENVLSAETEIEQQPIQYVVTASGIPGIFSLGGDLPLFIELIRQRDEATLRRYAHACIDVQFARATGYGLPVIGISLVQGDALGGGFEAALSSDAIIAERSAKFGLPEILFNLYPGMGAYSFLLRRLNASQAERMILSGRIYAAEELHELGVVDAVVPDGAGEQGVHDFMRRHGRQLAARKAVYDVRRIVNPISHAELVAVTDLWVRTAMRLGQSDLRKMEHLAVAQDRRLAGIANSR